MSRRGNVLVLTCLLAAIVSTAATAATIDPGASSIGFWLKTRWGQRLEGRFPDYEGEIATLPDGRHQVRFRLATGAVQIIGSPQYTRLTRGPGFFDAARHGSVVFVSDAYPAALMQSGGSLAGELTIRGRHQREVFMVEPSTCARPGVDCDVIAAGSVRRSDYGVDRWGFAVSDIVRFTLRVRVRGDLDS